MAGVDLRTLLGTAVKSGRSQLGISQEELANRAGLHRTYISDLERGARNPSIESFYEMAQAIQIFVSMLFGQTMGTNVSIHLVDILFL
jgi:transcriptional regulator with XRE-family HTH domain